MEQNASILIEAIPRNTTDAPEHITNQYGRIVLAHDGLEDYGALFVEVNRTVS